MRRFVAGIAIALLGASTGLRRTVLWANRRLRYEGIKVRMKLED